MGFSLSKTTRCMGTKYLTTLMSCITLVFLPLINLVTRLLKRDRMIQEEEEVRENYVLLMDGMCPMPIPVPVHQLTPLVKKTLPVVKYETLRLRHRSQQEQEEEDEEILMCPVCLEGIEGSDEVRVLHNCSHLFHRECMDRWMDEDQVTCPSCRSTLYPTKIRIHDLWAGRW